MVNDDRPIEMLKGAKKTQSMRGKVKRSYGLAWRTVDDERSGGESIMMELLVFISHLYKFSFIKYINE